MNNRDLLRSILETELGNWEPANTYTKALFSDTSPSFIRETYDKLEEFEGEKEHVTRAILGIAYVVDKNLFRELEDRYEQSRVRVR